MRLNWFSPLLPERTGIADYTAAVMPSLSKGADVILWTDQAEWDRKLEDYAEVQFYKPGQIDWNKLNRADLTVYNIGNNPIFHSSIWQTSRLHPGIVVLHDTRLQHFFVGLFRERWQDRQGYIDLMAYCYGEAGYEAAETFWDGGNNLAEMSELYPLTEAALKNSLGALVHTQEAFNYLKRGRRHPVVYAGLPHAATPRSREDQDSNHSRYADGPPYRLVIFGHIGTNRRMGEVLRALAEMSERDRFRLDVYGQIWDRGSVRSEVRSLGLDKQVTLHGFVPDAELDAALESAHVAINLRYPSMGEASAGQLRIWDHALPSLVTQTGWYARLPKDTVAFVRPEYEIADIQSHLRAYIADPAPFAEMGKNGRRMVEEHHSPDAYAQTLVNILHHAKRLRLRAVAYNLAERTGVQMGDWAKSDSLETYRKVAGEIINLVV